MAGETDVTAIIGYSQKIAVEHSAAAVYTVRIMTRSALDRWSIACVIKANFIGVWSAIPV